MINQVLSPLSSVAESSLASAKPGADPVIVVENVSKRYWLNQHRVSLRHETTQILRRMMKRLTEPDKTSYFWALRNVSFSVTPGEAVAIIGRNGAGKSTLFRILCGITNPTEGHVAVQGRFATLIALGVGFNPERTGRENIFLNAAIHGLSTRETRSIIDGIIAFAELGEFIDEPVKCYSSGMNARLGFSIAMHIVPDILFIDEILAVGDAPFQNKCIERIQSLKADGRTLMFVSHSPAAIRSLCQRAIWLADGQVVMDGSVEEVLTKYEAVAE